MVKSEQTKDTKKNKSRGVDVEGIAELRKTEHRKSALRMVPDEEDYIRMQVRQYSGKEIQSIHRRENSKNHFLSKICSCWKNSY